VVPVRSCVGTTEDNRLRRVSGDPGRHASPAHVARHRWPYQLAIPVRDQSTVAHNRISEAPARFGFGTPDIIMDRS